MGKTIHVISHTHWDREWYFTVDDSKILMNKAFDELLVALEQNKHFAYYMLDGQTSIIEEYLELKPQNKQRIESLVSSGRLITGPWYTQPDVFNAHGESILRNLAIGMKQANQLGKCMEIGYLPDTFGFNAQMPLLYNEMGLTKAIIRRGYDPKILKTTEFQWVALDGKSHVLTSVQPFGYSMGHPRRGARYRDLNVEQLRKETYPLLEKVKKLSASNQVMLTIGGDQVSVDQEIDKFIDVLQTYALDQQDKFIQSSLEVYFRALETEGPFPTYTGEFRSPRFARVHRTIHSSRYDIKKANYDAEMHLLRVSEVINAIAKRLGIYHDDENIERAWKLLLEAQAHDSLGGCNSDSTNQNILQRCSQAQHTSEGIFYLLGRLIGRNLDKKTYETQFFVLNGGIHQQNNHTLHHILTSTKNFDLYDDRHQKLAYTLLKQTKQQMARKVELTEEGERESEIKAYYYENELVIHSLNLPQLGYTTCYVKPCIGKNKQKVKKTNKCFLENEQIRLYIEDHQLCYQDKKRNICIKNFLSFEDCGDDGDLYDFSPLAEDSPIRMNHIDAYQMNEQGEFQQLVLTYKANVPKKINQQRTKRMGQSQLLIHVTLLLDAENYVKITITTHNHTQDHRLRLIVASPIQTTTSYASVPFGVQKREQQPIDKHWQKSYGECPIDIEPMSEFVKLEDEKNTLLVVAKGCKEYQLVGQTELVVTLYRSVGNLGKSDLTYRPGRESGRAVATPEAQLLKPLSFELGIFLADQKTAQQQVPKVIEAYETKVTSYQTQDFKRNFQQMDYFDVYVPNNQIPPTYSLVHEVPETFVFSSITSLQENLLLRLANYTQKQQIIDAKQVTGVTNALLTNALGEPKTNQTSVRKNSALTINY